MCFLTKMNGTNIAHAFFLHLIPRVVMFGDRLNAINISGIVVVNIGVLFHKATLHLSKTKDDATKKIEVDNKYVLCLSDDDCNDDLICEEDLSGRNDPALRSCTIQKIS